MGERYLKLKEFSGIDQSVNSLDLPIHAAPEALNMEANAGLLSTAKGYAAQFAERLPKRVMSLAVFRTRASFNKENLLASTADGLYRLNTSNSWVKIPGAPGGVFDYVNYAFNGDDVLYMANGIDQLAMWNGTAYSPATPKQGFCPNTICLSNERLWAGAPIAELETVYYSNEFSPNQWDGQGGGYIGIPSWEASKIVAVRNYFNEVVVFKDRDIFRIFGTYPGEFSVSKVHGEDGPCSAQSIVAYKDRVYFFNRNGICFYDGMRARPLGDERIKRVLANLNENFLSLCCAARIGSKLYFSVTSKDSVVNDTVIEYDADTKAYMVRSGISATCFVRLGDKLLFGAPDGGVYVYGEGRGYPGGDMEAYWVTPKMDLGSKYTRKYSTTMYTHAKGEGQLRIQADFGDRNKGKLIELSGTMRPIRFKLRDKGRTLQFKFSNVDGSVFDMHAPQVLVESDED